MYNIAVREDGSCGCSLSYQDGTENWDEKDLETAIQSMIKGAYAWNHSRINRQMINIVKVDPPVQKSIPPEDTKLLELLKTGYKKALDYDDFRLKANLLPEEVELIYAIREGRAAIVWRDE